MNRITTEQIEAKALTLDQIQDEVVMGALIDEMADAQPNLLAYLMTIGEDDFNEEERELMLFLGLLIWQCMGEAGEIATFTTARMHEIQALNFPLLESLETQGKGDFTANLEKILEDYPQAELLEYIVATISEDESYWIRPGNQYIMIIFLKIIIDCLDQT